MELLSPAGNIEKLYYAYTYGADAAYIGLKKFSLRVKADNFYEDEYKSIIQLKKDNPEKKLFCALNISFHNKDIDQFLADIDYFKQYPIDSFIVQDLGIVPILQKNFPNAHLHLSTQASCINREAVKMYQSIGFKRIVLGREASLKEIREIKDYVPEMELEVFAHGAMCIAYAGRCLMSAYMNGRSAQSGFCSHSCRWDFDLYADPKKLAQSGALLLKEHKRPDEYFPVFEGDDYTAILSSKDLCMIDHLKDLKEAGADTLKIEGRMKSTYYVALITRAYRKAIDLLEKKITEDKAKPFIDELYKVSHREFATGFFYNREDADKTTVGASDSEFDLVATVKNKLTDAQENAFFIEAQKKEQIFNEEIENMHPNAKKAYFEDITNHPEKKIVFAKKLQNYKLYTITPLNKIDSKTELEFVGPDIISLKAQPGDYYFIDPSSQNVMTWTSHNHECLLYTKLSIENNMLVRTKNPEYKEGIIKNTGR